jgi:hypothetical protein
MAKTPPRKRGKQEALREQGTLNPHPEKVTDSLFQENDFFDPRDLVQVKYEMLRRVQVDKAAVTQTSSAFGFSRVSFYQAQSTFDQHGLVGLLPGKRGPREAHKLTPEVLEFVTRTRVAQPALKFEDLAQEVARQFGTEVHPRSIERALARGQKKRR